MVRLSIVAPAYNEKEKISSFLDSLISVKEHSDIISEIIVVDDGSSDDTSRLAEKYNVEIIRHDTRKGYGASLKSGIRKAHEPLICIIDSDNTYAADDILRLASEMDGCDMVVGDRQDSHERPKDHLVVKKMMEGVLSSIFKTKIMDINSGIRIMKKDFLTNYLDMLPNGFSFTSSITLITLLKKRRIKYIPVKYDRRKKGSKIRRLDFITAFILSYTRIVYYFLKGSL
ncbi:MAG: glycosyltransferase family 2 protein [Candidatus Omnitrophica bacterium]|nr:glycosyltransferase family 2 protein [Candidatus Omnitrophota bacterium]